MRGIGTVGLAIAIAAALAGWTLGRGAFVPEPLPAVADPAPTASTPVVASADAPWLRLAMAVDQLAARVDALEGRSATAAPPTRVEAPTAAAAIDLPQLRLALEAIEAERLRERFAALADDELLAEVQRLAQENKDPAAADEALRHLLARPLDAERRLRATTQLGLLQRQRGDTLGAERTLRAVVDEAGMAAKTGAWAAYQLAWTLAERDPGAALGVADALAREAPDDGTRTRARWTTARLLEQTGDLVRARAAYEQLVAQCGDRKELWDVAKDARHRLEQIDRR
ncbi:MAG: hypothetical protein KF830_16545 [Planctomycetes bacterium]|nr:hypothetical protein [Planctomycetota bacterium]